MPHFDNAYVMAFDTLGNREVRGSIRECAWFVVGQEIEEGNLVLRSRLLHGHDEVEGLVIGRQNGHSAMPF